MTSPWTLSERYDYARYMARQGKSLDEIIEKTNLLECTVECIVNRERPGEIPTLGRKEKAE